MTPRILAIDAGGTMTDTFIVEEQGTFVVGKAQTTPEDESVGLLASAADALTYWNLDLQRALPDMVSGIYSGTTILNRLLMRKGRRLGVIVTAGQEDALVLERGVQTYLGYSYADRLHVVTHRHNEPLVPRAQIRGVRGRIDPFGEEALPLFEDEARSAVRELLGAGVEALCVSLLHAYRNPAHERRVAAIAREVFAEAGQEVPLFVASELYPLRGDFSRLNTLLVEAYAADVSREQLRQIQQRVRELGARFDLRVMASHGGGISVEARELARTLVSGPIGGVVGGRYLATARGLKNVACVDLGGTSFDVALITEGELSMKTQPDVARFLLAVPTVQVDSVGAGTGSFVRIDPAYRRIQIGPDSAGSRIGACWPEGGVSTVTVTDCHVVLGLIDPERFLGGKVRLDARRAHTAVEEQIAAPLGLDVFGAAAGVVEILEQNLQNEVASRILGKGFSPANFTLLAYGGGGPVHVANVARGLQFADILVPTWAAGFSAFGCACADFEYRSEMTVDLPLAAAGDDEKAARARLLEQAWQVLRTRVAEEFARSGIDAPQIRFQPALRMQYRGQLNDIEVASPVAELRTPQDLDAVVRAFEDLYGRIYARAARSPELGVFVTWAIMKGVIPAPKPRLPDESGDGERPPREAARRARQVYWRGQWAAAAIWDMDALRAGNRIAGPAVVEAPSTTLVVPPETVAWLDQNRIFHLSHR